MTDFQKVQAYQSAMTQAQIMLKNGIIGKDDIVSIEHKLAEKYGLKSAVYIAKLT